MAVVLNGGMNDDYTWGNNGLVFEKGFEQSGSCLGLLLRYIVTGLSISVHRAALHCPFCDLS